MMAPTNITASATATIVSATTLRARLGLALCKANKLFGAILALWPAIGVSQQPHIVQADNAGFRRGVALNMHNRHVVKANGAVHAASASKNSATGGGQRRVLGHAAHRARRNLPGAAGAYHRRLSTRCGVRHQRSPDRRLAVGTARPAIHRR